MTRLSAAIAAAATLTIGAATATAAPASAITDRQAVAWITTGKPLPGGNHNTIPSSQRGYALHMYRTGPYQQPALNLFYAIGAAATHYNPRIAHTVAQLIALFGRQALVDEVAKSAPHPAAAARYGVTVHQLAAAEARGMIAGMT